MANEPIEIPRANAPFEQLLPSIFAPGKDFGSLLANERSPRIAGMGDFVGVDHDAGGIGNEDRIAGIGEYGTDKPEIDNYLLNLF